MSPEDRSIASASVHSALAHNLCRCAWSVASFSSLYSAACNLPHHLQPALARIDRPHSHGKAPAIGRRPFRSESVVRLEEMDYRSTTGQSSRGATIRHAHFLSRAWTRSRVSKPGLTLSASCIPLHKRAQALGTSSPLGRAWSAVCFDSSWSSIPKAFNSRMSSLILMTFAICSGSSVSPPSFLL